MGAVRIACVICGLTVGLLVPAAASATWTSPVTIGAGGIFPGYPSVGFGGDGSGLVAWLPRDDEDDPNPDSRLLTLAPGARPLATRSVSGRLLGPPGLFGRDRVVLLRGRDLSPDRLRAGDARVSVAFGTTRRPVGRWRDLVTIEDPSVVGGDAALAVNRRGDAVVGWAADGRLRVAVRARGQDFAAPETLARFGEFDEPQFELAIGARGDAIVVYTTSQRVRRGYRGAVVARVRPAGRHFAPARSLGPTRGRTDISAAVAPDGRAVVAWGSVDPGEEVNEPYDVFAVVGLIDRGFGAPQTLERGNVVQVPSGNVVTAIAANGTATVAFSPARRGQDPVVAATARAGGRFGRPAELAPGWAEAVTTAADGTAIVVWIHDGRVRAATRTADAARFGRPEDVSSPTEAAASADIALDHASHRATVVWDSIERLKQPIATPTRHVVRLAQRPLR